MYCLFPHSQAAPDRGTCCCVRVPFAWETVRRGCWSFLSNFRMVLWIVQCVMILVCWNVSGNMSDPDWCTNAVGIGFYCVPLVMRSCFFLTPALSFMSGPHEDVIPEGPKYLPYWLNKAMVPVGLRFWSFLEVLVLAWSPSYTPDNKL